MIFYLTKETVERYKFQTPDRITVPETKAMAEMLLANQGGDRLHEWGGKLFYFQRRKCLQLVNFASKLTIVLMDIKMEDKHDIGSYLSLYVCHIFRNDPEMTEALEKYFTEVPVFCMDYIHDRSIISTLNRNEYECLEVYYPANYIRDGILHGAEMNEDINREWLLSQKIDGKTEYFFPVERFRELILTRYGK